MFTGIISAIGEVVEFTGSSLKIKTPWKALALGESISVDGVCLTVVQCKKGVSTFDVGPETRRISTLKSVERASRVNLERALRVGDRLGGHWVTGHVEGMGRIKSVKPVKDAWWLSIDIPAPLRRYVISKGSIAIDGVSLTVARRRSRDIDLMIVPHTWTHTTLSLKRPGDPVNLETDLLAKYALR